MSAFTNEERIALLLSVLGPQVVEATTQALHPTRASYINRLVQDYQVNPPSDAEIDFVLDDFLKYFHFALQTLEPEIKKRETELAESDDSPASNKKRVDANRVTYFPKLEPTGDPVRDLNKLDPYQLAVALNQDHPKTVALVLGRLQPQLAAEVLAELPESTRNAAVIFLSQESTVPALIQEKVLSSTVAKAITVEYRENQVDQTQILADLMRSVPKALRSELIAQLEEADEEFCAEVKQRLYIFEDIGRLGDRDVQKLLGEIKTDFLIIGLQQANPALTEKLLGNLSKRARQSVVEEMQYKTNATEEEIESARAELTAVLARLDEAGEVSLS